MKQWDLERRSKLLVVAAIVGAAVPLNAGGIAMDPRSGAVVQAQGQEVRVAPAFGASPNRTFRTPGYFAPRMFRNGVVFGEQAPGADTDSVAVVYDLAGKKLFECANLYTASLTPDGSALVTAHNPLGDEQQTWEFLAREARKSQLPMPRKDAFIVRSCKLQPLACEFDFYGPELFGLEDGGSLTAAAGVAHRDAVLAIAPGVVARVKEGKLVWRTEVVDTLSHTPEVWDLRPEWDALLLGSDHSGDLWLLDLSTGEIRGRWVPTGDAKLAAALFPQGLEKAVSKSCWWSSEEGKAPVPASYLEHIQSSGKEVFLKAELIHVWMAKIVDGTKALAVIGGFPSYTPIASRGALECPMPYRMVAVDLRTGTALTVRPVSELFPEALRTHPSFDPRNYPRPQIATGAGNIVLCMHQSSNDRCTVVSQQALR
mgnify:CR=1 FL=1